MMEFDDILNSKMKKTQTVNTEECVVIGETTQLNLRLFGCINGGNAVLDLGNGKALKFTRQDTFKLGNGKPAYNVTIQVLDAGIGKKVRNQSWNATKTVTKTITKEVEKKDEFKISGGERVL